MSFCVGENVNWYHCYREQYGDSLRAYCLLSSGFFELQLFMKEVLDWPKHSFEFFRKMLYCPRFCAGIKEHKRRCLFPKLIHQHTGYLCYNKSYLKIHFSSNLELRFSPCPFFCLLACNEQDQQLSPGELVNVHVLGQEGCCHWYSSNQPKSPKPRVCSSSELWRPCSCKHRTADQRAKIDIPVCWP